MSVICPTILASTPEEYKQQVEIIHPFAQRVQIDITDGQFAPSQTVAPTEVWWPREWQADVHMMVVRPSQYLDTIIKMNPHMVIFHAECEEDLVPIFEKLKAETKIKPAVALLRSTVPETVASAIEAAKHVLVFSGNLGEMGGRASMMQVEKIRLIKAINPQAEIGWDGGANPTNAFTLSQGGVDVINVGSAIMRASDPQAAYQSMVEEVNRKGTI